MDEVAGYSCTCTGDWLGDHCNMECGCGENGQQRGIISARAAGDCSAGVCACLGGNAVGEFCEETCGEHGTSDGRKCDCAGDWMGDRCDSQCLCGEHGTQASIKAARAAGDCSAGSCACDGNYIGATCDVECGCGEHGTQSGIVSARAADSCAAGSCICEGEYIGERCDSQCLCGSHGTQTNIEAVRPFIHLI